MTSNRLCWKDLSCAAILPERIQWQAYCNTSGITIASLSFSFSFFLFFVWNSLKSSSPWFSCNFIWLLPLSAGILPDEEAEPERQESRARHLGKLPSDLALAFFFFLFFFTSTQTVHILAPGYRRAGEIPCTWTHLLPRQQWRTFGVWHYRRGFLSESNWNCSRTPAGNETQNSKKAVDWWCRFIL